MFERFTAYARRAVVMAQEEARELSHNYIGTEHILLGAARRPEASRSRSGGQPSSASFGMTLDGVREEVIDKVGRGKGKAKPGTSRSRRGPRRCWSCRCARRCNSHHNYIGTEHILLGLIREGEGVAAQIMREHADLLAIRAAVLDAVPAGDGRGGQARGDHRCALLRRVRAAASGSVTDRGAEPATCGATPAIDATLARGRPAGGRRARRVAPPAAGRPGRSELGRRADTGLARRGHRPARGELLPHGGRHRHQRRAAGGGRPPPDVPPGVRRDAHRRHRRPGAGDGRQGGPGGREREAEAGGEGESAAGRAAAGGSATTSVIRGDHPAAASLAAVWRELRKSLAKIAAQRRPFGRRF